MKYPVGIETSTATAYIPEALTQKTSTKAIGVILGLAALATACEMPSNSVQAPYCASTEASAEDSKNNRPELSEAVDQAIAIYYKTLGNDQLHRNRGSSDYENTVRMTIPDAQKEIVIDVDSDRHYFNMTTAFKMNTSIFNEKTRAFEATHSVIHSPDGKWRFASSYLTQVAPDGKKTYTNYEATPGSYACVYQSMVDKRGNPMSGSHSAMGTYQAEARTIANESAGRLLVLVGAMQHITPGVTEYSLPDVGSNIFEAAKVPQPTQRA